MRKLRVVSKGGLVYPHQVRGTNKRGMGWAVLKVRRTGHKFLFTTTHLTPTVPRIRIRQWNDMVNKIQKLRGSMPVVATGDFNASKFSWFAKQPLSRMRAVGIPDALGQTFHRTNNPLRPDSKIDTWVSSFNDFRRNVRPFAYESAHGKAGNGVDWIFASKRLDVKQFEVVTNIGKDLRIDGIIPSDHFMLRATIRMP